MKKPTCVFILGNGFSQGIDFPSFHQLWKDCLRLSSKTGDSEPYFKELLGNYPLSYFQEKNITDIELLLSVWSIYIDSYKKIIPDGEASGSGDYDAYIENLCCHLLEYGDKATANSNYALFKKWLAEKMEFFEFRFMTLNYDLLLEKIVNENKSDIVYLGDPTRENSVTIRKLHGSVNWLKSDKGGLERTDGWKPPILWNSEKLYIYNINDDYSNVPYSAFGPHSQVLIPPTLNKEYEGIFQELLKFAVNDLQKAKFVIIVGYSLPKADILIREVLKNYSHNLSSGWSKFIYINPSQQHCEEAKELLNGNLEIIDKKWDIELFNEILRKK